MELLLLIIQPFHRQSHGISARTSPCSRLLKQSIFLTSFFLSLSNRKSRLITCSAQKQEPTPPHDRPGNRRRLPRRCFTRLVSFDRYNVNAPAGSSSFSFLEARVFFGPPHQSTHRHRTRAIVRRDRFLLPALSNWDQAVDPPIADRATPRRSFLSGGPRPTEAAASIPPGAYLRRALRTYTNGIRPCISLWSPRIGFSRSAGPPGRRAAAAGPRSRTRRVRPVSFTGPHPRPSPSTCRFARRAVNASLFAGDKRYRTPALAFPFNPGDPRVD